MLIRTHSIKIRLNSIFHFFIKVKIQKSETDIQYTINDLVSGHRVPLEAP